MSDDATARWGDDAAPLNLAQRNVLDRLGAKPADRRDFSAELAGELRAELEDGLLDVVSSLERPPLVISKAVLEGVHGCEVRYLAGNDFSWNAASAKGAVAHKAIEVAVTRPSVRLPLDLVDEAIARFQSEEWGLGDFLARASESTIDDVRTQANTRLATFLETWPPLKRAWVPVTESSIRVELLDDALVLSGRPDLTLGMARGQRAGKVIVDFKTGGHSATHRADLRFYALLDTLKLGTPPRLLATSYLDSGTLETEQVSEELLFAEARRVVDAGRRVVALAAAPDQAVRRPGAPCQWCSLSADCEDGQRYLAGRRDAW